MIPTTPEAAMSQLREHGVTAIATANQCPYSGRIILHAAPGVYLHNWTIEAIETAYGAPFATFNPARNTLVMKWSNTMQAQYDALPKAEAADDIRTIPVPSDDKFADAQPLTVAELAAMNADELVNPEQVNKLIEDCKATIARQGEENKALRRRNYEVAEESARLQTAIATQAFEARKQALADARLEEVAPVAEPASSLPATSEPMKLSPEMLATLPADTPLRPVDVAAMVDDLQGTIAEQEEAIKHFHRFTPVFGSPSEWDTLQGDIATYKEALARYTATAVEEIPVIAAAPTPRMKTEVRTLVQQFRYGDDAAFADDELAEALEDGWQVIDVAVNTVVRKTEADSTWLDAVEHYRIVTLSRVVPDVAHAPRPAVAAVDQARQFVTDLFGDEPDTSEIPAIPVEQPEPVAAALDTPVIKKVNGVIVGDLPPTTPRRARVPFGKAARATVGKPSGKVYDTRLGDLINEHGLEAVTALQNEQLRQAWNNAVEDKPVIHTRIPGRPETAYVVKPSTFTLPTGA